MPVPPPILEAFSLYRPTPLVYASDLKRRLETPAHIFYKYEGVGPTGSHKSNTAITQAFLAAQEGVETLVTETGAGQWGSALSHAGGLRYHGMAPLVSHLVDKGIVKARAYPQEKIFAAAETFLRAEGVLPAPESSHAVAAAIDEALEAKDSGRERIILFNLSGHGFLDISAFDRNGSRQRPAITGAFC